MQHTLTLDVALDTTIDQTLQDVLDALVADAPGTLVTVVAEDGPAGWPVVRFECPTDAETFAVATAYCGGQTQGANGAAQLLSDLGIDLL